MPDKIREGSVDPRKTGKIQETLVNARQPPRRDDLLEIVPIALGCIVENGL
jgi:hypothetical protein